MATIRGHVDDEGVSLPLNDPNAWAAARTELGDDYDNAVGECPCCGERSALLTLDEWQRIADRLVIEGHDVYTDANVVVLLPPE